jgi:hypothetical protein
LAAAAPSAELRISSPRATSIQTPSSPGILAGGSMHDASKFAAAAATAPAVAASVSRSASPPSLSQSASKAAALLQCMTPAYSNVNIESVNREEGHMDVASPPKSSSVSVSQPSGSSQGYTSEGMHASPFE